MRLGFYSTEELDEWRQFALLKDLPYADCPYIADGRILIPTPKRGRTKMWNHYIHSYAVTFIVIVERLRGRVVYCSRAFAPGGTAESTQFKSIAVPLFDGQVLL